MNWSPGKTAKAVRGSSIRLSGSQKKGASEIMARVTLKSGILPNIGSLGHRTTKDLTSAQLWLLRIMSEYQFGRIELLGVRDGQPLVLPATKVVRVSRLGGRDTGTRIPNAEDFDLKQVVRDLFAELDRLKHGTVVRLEFRHGLPCLLETEAEVGERQTGS